MEQIRELLEELGERLGYLSSITAESREALAAAGLLEKLCQKLYRVETEVGSGGLTYSREVESRKVAEPAVTEGSTLVPMLRPRSTELATDMLAKTTLYADTSVVATAEAFHRQYITYSEPPRTLLAEPYLQVLEWNRRCRSLVRSGKCVFLPHRYRVEIEDLTDDWKCDDYLAPLVQQPSGLSYVPANMVGSSPFADLFVYGTVLLPYFPRANLEDVAMLARKETDSFLLFNKFLRQRLVGIGEAGSPEEISDIVEDIKSGVALLRLEARKLARTKLFRNMEVAFFGVTVGALFGLDPAVAKEVAAVSGSVSVHQLVQAQKEISDRSLDLRKSDFYIPYLLSR